MELRRNGNFQNPGGNLHKAKSTDDIGSARQSDQARFLQLVYPGKRCTDNYNYRD